MPRGTLPSRTRLQRCPGRFAGAPGAYSCAGNRFCGSVSVWAAFPPPFSAAHMADLAPLRRGFFLRVPSPPPSSRNAVRLVADRQKPPIFGKLHTFISTPAFSPASGGASLCLSCGSG